MCGGGSWLCIGSIAQDWELTLFPSPYAGGVSRSEIRALWYPAFWRLDWAGVYYLAGVPWAIPLVDVPDCPGFSLSQARLSQSHVLTERTGGDCDLRRGTSSSTLHFLWPLFFPFALTRMS